MLNDKLVQLLCFVNQDKEKREMMNAIIEKCNNEMHDEFVTEEEQIEKIVALAKEAGIELIPDKMEGQALNNENLLLDNEFDDITGGSGQINVKSDYGTEILSCNKVANDTLFSQYYYCTEKDNHCPYYNFKIFTHSTLFHHSRDCISCQFLINQSRHIY